MEIKNTAVFVAGTMMLIGLATSCGKDNTVNYDTAVVELKNISTGVTATGTIEPVTEVEVGTQVSGIIDKIYVDYNSVVRKGQVIAELDKTNLQSELVSAQSNLTDALSNLTYRRANYERYRTLYDKGLVSANDFESARLSYQQAAAQVHVQRQSVHKARTNLGYATITAPIDGVVLSKEVEEGQTVASAMTTPTLFIIAKDLTDMRVIADIDEADIGGVRAGQRVTFTVDAYPDDTFNGAVTQVRQKATTESNVVTYQVVISARNNDLKLKPGLTANVTILTQEKNNILAVPSKALRFVPNRNLMKKDEKIIDCQGKNKVWMHEGSTFKAVPVNVGISNGTLTEVSGNIKAGMEIITQISADVNDERENGGDNNPFMPHPKDNKKSGQSGPGSSSSDKSKSSK